MPKDYAYMDDRPGGFYNDDLTKSEERKLRREYQRKANEKRGDKKKPVYTKRKQGMLETIGVSASRVGSVFITIFVLLVGAPLAAKYPDRLDNFPNADPNNHLYVQTHEYVDNIDFAQFGAGAIDNVYATIETIGRLASPIYIIITGDTTTVDGGYTYDMNKFLKDYLTLWLMGTSLTDAKAYWATLSAGAKTHYTDNIYPQMGAIIQTFYWSPTQLNS